MAYDPVLAEQVRRHLASQPDVVEKTIVGGGLGFMVSGHLCCGVSNRGLTVRVGADARDEAVARPYVVPLRFGKREAAAFVLVEPAGLDGASLIEWVDTAVRFVATLEPR